MPEKELCVVLGGGGHSRVVIDALLTSGRAAPYGILESDPTLWGTEVLGVRVLGGDDLLPILLKEGVRSFVVGVGGVHRSMQARRRGLFENALALGLSALIIVSPAAACSQWSTLGPGSVVLPGAIVNAGAVIGMNAIINSGAIVEHDCTIGDHVHIASGARLAGSVRVADGAFVGAGATVLQGLQIGRDAVVGAGAVVLESVAAGATVVGVPARPLPVK